MSAPIAWSELDTITADAIKLRDVRARLDKLGDPWATLRAKPGSITAAAKRLAATVP